MAVLVEYQIILYNYAGDGCGKELGISDGGISDFQISASTETGDHPADQSRPGLSGWCADPRDEAPYRQVHAFYNNFCLFELMLNDPLNSCCHVGTSPSL